MHSAINYLLLDSQVPIDWELLRIDALCTFSEHNSVLSTAVVDAFCVCPFEKNREQTLKIR